MPTPSDAVLLKSRRRPPFARIAVRIVIALIIALILVPTCFGLFLVAYGNRDRVAPADVIIVLGGGVLANGNPSISSARRIEHAIALYQKNTAPYLICTGSTNIYRNGRTSAKSEGAACRDYMISIGVPASAILTEENSTSTEENVIESQKIMQARGLQTAVVVSNNYHLFRARWLFAKYGLDVFTSPAEATARPLSLGTQINAAIREEIALMWEAIKSVFGIKQTATPF